MKKLVLYPRHIQPLLQEALRDSPLVLIHGPRQCGKTTLAKMLKPAKKYTYINFDNEALLQAARLDPVGFASELPGRAILDEVQRVPTLFSALKMVVDEDRRPGRFILTGSANILHVPKLSDSLSGRVQILRLHPLSQGELLRRKSYFLDELFSGAFKSHKISHVPLAHRILTGGYPAPLLRPFGRRRTNWYLDYMETLVHRDIVQLSRVRSTDTLPRLLTLCAGTTAGLVNFTSLANAFQLNRSTIQDYITLLERAFLIEKLPPWHSRYLKRLIKTPKLHFCDTGLAAALLSLTPDSLKKNTALAGALLETYIFQELKRQASSHTKHHTFYHYRDKKNVEVDIVIERERFVAGVEVKSAATVFATDFKGLYKLKKALGTNFVCGALLYNGSRILRFGEGFYAVPISFL